MSVYRPFPLSGSPACRLVGSLAPPAARAAADEGRLSFLQIYLSHGTPVICHPRFDASTDSAIFRPGIRGRRACPRIAAIRGYSREALVRCGQRQSPKPLENNVAQRRRDAGNSQRGRRSHTLQGFLYGEWTGPICGTAPLRESSSCNFGCGSAAMGSFTFIHWCLFCAFCAAMSTAKIIDRPFAFRQDSPVWDRTDGGNDWHSTEKGVTP
jgi:hypothetical protein